MKSKTSFSLRSLDRYLDLFVFVGKNDSGDGLAQHPLLLWFRPQNLRIKGRSNFKLLLLNRNDVFSTSLSRYLIVFLFKAFPLRSDACDKYLVSS